MEAKILRLPEPLLLAILDFSVTFDQVEFVRVSSSALHLWRKIRRIEMDATSFLRSSIQYQKEIISQVHNPYNQSVLMFDTRLSNEEELQSARDEIQRAYNEENKNEKTKDTDILLMGNENENESENLYNMVISNWSFESLHYLVISSKDIFPIFHLSKLRRINTIYIVCHASDDSDSIQKIFEYFRKKNSSEGLELKDLGLQSENDKEKIKLDTVPSIVGLTELSLYSFEISNLECFLKFPHLKELSLSECDITGDINCLDSIDKLDLYSCSFQVGDISGLNHNRKITIARCKGVKDFSKSFKYSQYIRLDISEFDSIVDLGYYHNPLFFN